MRRSAFEPGIASGRVNDRGGRCGGCRRCRGGSEYLNGRNRAFLAEVA